MPTERISESYEFQNTVRDLSDDFNTLVHEYPTLISRILNLNKKATHTKHEYLEDYLGSTASAVAGFDTDGTGTGVEVADTAAFKAGDIIRFEKATGASVTEMAKIASIDSGTQLTLSRTYGGTAASTLVIGDIAKLVSRPKGENTDSTTGTSREPGKNYNYTEIFDDEAQISSTAANIRQYGFESFETWMNYQVEMKMIDIMKRMDSATVYGRRVERSAGQNGTMGGIMQFLENGNETAVGGALTSSVINDLLEDIFEDGGYSNNFAILCNSNQARKISQFNKAGVANSPVITSQDDRKYGGYIQKFIGDLPVANGFEADIVISSIFPKDQIAIVDLNGIELIPLGDRAFIDKDSTQNGGDYFRRRLISEMTLEVKNGTRSHAKATGLTI